MRRLNVMVSCFVVGATGASALAQDQPGRGRGNRPDQPAGERQPGDRPARGGQFGGQQLPPEKAKAAWELQAKGVAKRLGLNEEQTKVVVKAYSDARQSHTDAMDKAREEMRGARGEGEDAGRPDPAQMRQRMEDLNTKEREKLQKALSAKLNPDQTTKAVASLGTFNPGWDRMADALGGLNLEGAKQQDALNAVEEFVVAQGKMRRGPDVDMQEMREAMQAAREKLDAALKKVLTDEQLEKFQAATRGGMRGPGGPGGEGRPRRNRDGGGGGGGGF